jgi:hypothetical protein
MGVIGRSVVLNISFFIKFSTPIRAGYHINRKFRILLEIRVINL